MTLESEAQDTTILHGHVKWFDPTKGFGFVIADEGGADILLHANVLRNFGQSSVADGAGIEIEVQDTQRGRQAVTVRAITPPETTEILGLAEEQSEEFDLANAGPVVPARVKWFDKGKGFGFANIFGSDEDVFIHIEVLRRSGLADLQPGEAICLSTIQGKRGKLALVVSAWDSAVNAVR